ncbi:glycosyltransferase [Pseudonocardia sp. GCM10023141]|uniref:glycosyltransferase n=1 Tax=Pseudonocardia sp. GCM10023141 TaxID=3252653 RepID=UPI00361ECBC2
MLARAPRRLGPLRVLFVVPDLGVGGAERHVATLAPALDPARFTASVVCIGDEGALFAGLAAAGVPAGALHRRRNPLLALIGLVRLMRRDRPDIVITRGYNAEALGRIAALLTRVPRSVVWVHNCGDVVPRGRVRTVVDRLLAPATSAYYAVAHGQRPYLTGELGYPDPKIEVIHNGVDVARFPLAVADPALAAELGVDPAAPVIGIVAVLRPEKDHETLLRATRLVIDEVPDTRLLVIGDGPVRGELERLARDLGIADSVTFLGTRPDVGRLLGLVDVVVLSSHTVECFPMALLEAMAAGVPTVGTAIGGVPEMIDDGVTGHVVPPRDPRALADALVKMLRDPQRSAAMGRAARRRVESLFTLDRSVRGAEAALARTAGRTPVQRPVQLAVVLDLTFVGGAEMVMLNLFRQLDRSIVAPRLICLREEGPLAADFRAAGVPVDVLERSGRYDLSTVPRLVRSLRAQRIDVVMVAHHHRAALTLGRLAARLAGVRANIVAAHDMDLSRVGGRVLPRHDVETLFLSDALVLLAPSQGRYLRREEGVGRYPWRQVPEVVIPNGIVVGPPSSLAARTGARVALGLDASHTVLGIVARLSSQKDHGVLLRAVAKLAADRPGLRLVVVGGGEEEARLRALVFELGIENRVTFTGIRRDVADLLPGFDVSCLSSVHEGAPLTVLESMAAGLPVIATDCGALRDMVADGQEGFIVPAGDSAAYTASLARLVDDPALRTEMGARARARAERECSIEHTVAGYQELLTRLVAR